MPDDPLDSCRMPWWYMALLLLADGALPNVSEDVAGALRFDKAGLAIGVPFR